MFVYCVFLLTPFGDLLFRHRSLPFGARGAVWAYHRTADLIIHIMRYIFLVPAIHYVDDYGGVEPKETASTALSTFEEFCEIIGWKTKHKKRQPAAARSKILGQYLTLSKGHATISNTEEKLAEQRNHIKTFYKKI